MSDKKVEINPAKARGYKLLEMQRAMEEAKRETGSFAEIVAELDGQYQRAYMEHWQPERAREERDKVNQRQQEIIKLILADFLIKAGGELIFPLARLTEMENKQMVIMEDEEVGMIRMVLLPDEVMAGVHAAQEERARELEIARQVQIDARRREEEQKLERQARIDAKNRDELRILQDAKNIGKTIDPSSAEWYKKILTDAKGMYVKRPSST